MKLPEDFTYSVAMTIDPAGKNLYFSAKNPAFFANNFINIAHGTLNEIPLLT